MPNSFESGRYQQSTSHVDVIMRPDGIKTVELTTLTDKIVCILRNEKPYITSSTGTMNFEKLSPEDQELVRKALCD